MNPNIGNISPLLPFLAPLVKNITVPIAEYNFPLGLELAEVLEDLRDGKLDPKETRRLAFMTVMNASHLLEREVIIAGRSFEFTPFVVKLAKNLSDDNLSQQDIQELLPTLLAVVLASKAVPKVPAGVPIVIPAGGVNA